MLCGNDLSIKTKMTVFDHCKWFTFLIGRFHSSNISFIAPENTEITVIENSDCKPDFETVQSNLLSSNLSNTDGGAGG